MINPTRRHVAQMLGLALALGSFGLQAQAQEQSDGSASNMRQGKLFMSTNASTGNLLQVYARSDTGPATWLMSLPTQGTGTDAGLGSQGAVTLSSDGRYLFVVNAGSNSVSTFKLGSKRLVLSSTVASGGTRPISVAERSGIVYVLNAPAAGTGNSVVGFRNEEGVLTPLADGTRALADASGPAQVGFDATGAVLVVSEKAANQLVSYAVGSDGALASSPEVTASPGAVPFGFAITKRNVLVVSEAAGSSASSYRIGADAGPALHPVTSALANGQIAACWVAVTPNGRYAYTSNAASSNISAYGIKHSGALSLVQAQAGFTSGNGALDLAVTPSGSQLHIFASRAPQQIVSFSIGSDGSLSKIGSLDVSAGAGLAAN
jgi:6-phosphogluconolactonase (cycloisomerase 2 family)